MGIDIQLTETARRILLLVVTLSSRCTRSPRPTTLLAHYSGIFAVTSKSEPLSPKELANDKEARNRRAQLIPFIREMKVVKGHVASNPATESREKADPCQSPFTACLDMSVRTLQGRGTNRNQPSGAAHNLDAVARSNRKWLLAVAGKLIRPSGGQPFARAEHCLKLTSNSR